MDHIREAVLWTSVVAPAYGLDENAIPLVSDATKSRMISSLFLIHLTRSYMQQRSRPEWCTELVSDPPDGESGFEVLCGECAAICECDQGDSCVCRCLCPSQNNTDACPWTESHIYSESADDSVSDEVENAVNGEEKKAVDAEAEIDRRSADAAMVKRMDAAESAEEEATNCMSEPLADDLGEDNNAYKPVSNWQTSSELVNDILAFWRQKELIVPLPKSCIDARLELSEQDKRPVRVESYEYLKEHFPEAIRRWGRLFMEMLTPLELDITSNFVISALEESEMEPDELCEALLFHAYAVFLFGDLEMPCEEMYIAGTPSNDEWASLIQEVGGRSDYPIDPAVAADLMASHIPFEEFRLWSSDKQIEYLVRHGLSLGQSRVLQSILAEWNGE